METESTEPEVRMEEEERKIFISGSGGQGVLLLGKVLATAGMLDGKNVTWIPSYGAEMRGGIVDCSVIISCEDIGSPVVKEPNILVAMNGQALEKYTPMVVAKGLILANRSLIESPAPRSDVETLLLPALEMARAFLGHTRLANMVMLGVLCSKTKIVPRERIEESIHSLMPHHDKELISLNVRALYAGIEYIDRIC
ncbi:MAG: 2-oxoacid:acceptor oxidoreductase family protein [bacterium]